MNHLQTTQSRANSTYSIRLRLLSAFCVLLFSCFLTDNPLISNIAALDIQKASLKGSTVTNSILTAQHSSALPSDQEIKQPPIHSRSYKRCLSPKADRKWTRRFEYRGKTSPLLLEVTNRVSHRLISYIVLILLRDILLYDDVQLVPQSWDSPYHALNRLRKNHSSPKDIPKAFINMEVWVPPGFNVEAWVHRGEVIDCGPLGPITQLGIFTRQVSVQQILHQQGLALDHYRSLQHVPLRDWLSNGILTSISMTNASESWNISGHNILLSSSSSSFSSFKANQRHPVSQWRSVINQCNTSNNLVSNVRSSTGGRGDDARNSLMNFTCLKLFADRSEFLKPIQVLLDTIFTEPTFEILLGPPKALTQLIHGNREGESRMTDQNNRNTSIKEVMRFGSTDFFVDWYPSIVTVTGGFARLILPDSYESATADETKMDHSSLGNFTMNQLNKVVWSELANLAKPAFNLVKRLTISQKDYEHLLSKAFQTVERNEDDDDEYFDVACDWLKSNHHKWQPWVVESNKKTELIIGAMFPGYGKRIMLELDKAASNAVQDLNRAIFQNTQYVLKLNSYNLSCDEDVILENYLTQAQSCNTDSPLVGIVAAMCSFSMEALIKLTNHQRRIVITSTPEAAKYISARRYPYYFRTVPSMRYYSRLLVDFFEMHNWKRVVLIWNVDRFIDKNPFRTNNIQVLEEFFLNEEKILTFSMAYEYLQKTISKFARIFVVELDAKETNMVMCAAAKLNMTFEKGYVWFFNSWLPKFWYLKEQDIPSNCTRDEMSYVGKTYFVIKHYIGSSPRIVEQDQPTGKNSTNLIRTNPPHERNARSVEDDDTESGSEMERQDEEIRPSNVLHPSFRTNSDPNMQYKDYTYDAVYVLGLAVAKLLELQPNALASLDSVEVAEKFLDILSKTHWLKQVGHGAVTKTLVSFNKDNERSSGLWMLLQHIEGFDVSTVSWHAEQKTKVENVRGRTPTYINSVIPLYRYNENPIKWPGNSRNPLDDGLKAYIESIEVANPCPFSPLDKHFGMTCDATTAMIYSLIVVIFVIIVGCGSICFWYRNPQPIDEYEREYNQLCMELQPLEISHPNIVINRQIGRGAFATVYGGELRWKCNDHFQWKNVAVKASSENASYEAKIPFLKEALLMSKLNHPNVLKLYGVCLTAPSNVIYLIMELMKLNDLKSYLLARRSDCFRNPGRSDISPRTLTKFAIDIAHGLEYMHQHNLIHRDVACRNCLVDDYGSDNYIVKLSDFGLTREFQNPLGSRYYRLKRHVEQPIRWMSPQAINFGIFDVQSDIWSYGVTLFEIITFGAFPMAYIMDSDVRNSVMRHQLNVVSSLPPSAINTGAHTLIDWCCQFETEKRPENVSEIIAVLKTHQDIIRPYLTESPPKMTFSETVVPTKRPLPPPVGNRNSSVSVSSYYHNPNLVDDSPHPMKNQSTSFPSEHLPPSDKDIFKSSTTVPSTSTEPGRVKGLLRGFSSHIRNVLSPPPGPGGRTKATGSTVVRNRAKQFKKFNTKRCQTFYSATNSNYQESISEHSAASAPEALRDITLDFNDFPYQNPQLNPSFCANSKCTGTSTKESERLLEMARSACKQLPWSQKPSKERFLTSCLLSKSVSAVAPSRFEKRAETLPKAEHIRIDLTLDPPQHLQRAKSDGDCLKSHPQCLLSPSQLNYQQFFSHKSVITSTIRDDVTVKKSELYESACSLDSSEIVFIKTPSTNDVDSKKAGVPTSIFF